MATFASSLVMGWDEQRQTKQAWPYGGGQCLPLRTFWFQVSRSETFTESALLQSYPQANIYLKPPLPRPVSPCEKHLVLGIQAPNHLSLIHTLKHIHQVAGRSFYSPIHTYPGPSPHSRARDEQGLEKGNRTAALMESPSRSPLFFQRCSARPCAGAPR